MASVRFICGTQTLHKELEHAISQFLQMQDTILYSSCFDANGGVFEVLFGAEDAIISGRAQPRLPHRRHPPVQGARYRYRNADMADLEAQLEAAKDARRKVIVTDGVFSMDGYLAPLDQICDLAEKHGALVLVDDSHAVGFIGAGGRGTPEHFGVMDRVDIITGTLGKALGGASGGYVSAHQEIVDLLRQRSRPYLFSNAVAPVVAAGSLKAIEIAAGSDEARRCCGATRPLFRELMAAEGFDLLPGTHPITPVMFPGEDGARARRRSPTRCSPRASTSSPSPTRWSRRARRGSGCSSQPLTRRRTCGPAWLPSSRLASALARSRSPRGCDRCAPLDGPAHGAEPVVRAGDGTGQPLAGLVAVRALGNVTVNSTRRSPMWFPLSSRSFWPDASTVNVSGWTRLVVM